MSKTVSKTISKTVSKTVLMIDPPSGWKYGFPMPVPDPRPENMMDWLVEQGYPQKEIDACGQYFYCRYWETETKIEDGEAK
jgi:hypothetical protein